MKTTNQKKKHTYKNSFYKPGSGNSEEYLTCERDPIEYRGYQIYPRIWSGKIYDSGNCFDVVENGVCIRMMTTLDGAKNSINRHIIRNQKRIVQERLENHFRGTDNSWNVPVDLPFMNEMLDETQALCESLKDEFIGYF